MRTKIVEAVCRGGGNRVDLYARYLVGQLDGEWKRRPKAYAEVAGLPDEQVPVLLALSGWARGHVLVLDLDYGKGGMVLPGRAGASPSVDARKMDTCPPIPERRAVNTLFLAWLYGWFDQRRDGYPLVDNLPDVVDPLPGWRE